jgi:hypothetical protein
MQECAMLQPPKFGSHLVRERWSRAQAAYVLSGADTEPQLIARAPGAATLGANGALLGQRGELLAAEVEGR